MVIKELDMNKINNVFLKLTKEIEELRKSNSERESDIAELNGALTALTARVTALENGE
jgi:uncharacterized coiled-coil DUF342 family protein